jgi:hypothetical protein
MFSSSSLTSTQFLHMLIIFVILGIGADDVFVFVDAFNQIPQVYPEAQTDLLLHMDLTYRRAAKAMLVTSATTMAAFAATIPSTIMPISSFGIFAALLVFMNYVFVITLFPAVVVVWHKYFRYAKHCCCHVELPDAPQAITKDPPSTVVVNEINPKTEGNDEDPEIGEDALDISEHKHYRTSELFFYHKVSPWLNKYKLAIVPFFVILFVVMIALGTQVCVYV